MAVNVRPIYVASVGGKFGATFENRGDIPDDTFFMVIIESSKQRAVKRAKAAVKRTAEILAA